MIEYQYHIISKLQSWIHATLSLRVLETLLNHDCTSASDTWNTLNQLFLDHTQPTRMNLRFKFQTFTKGTLTMTHFLQQIHSLYCSLREPLLETDLIAQILLVLPPQYAPFVTVMNNTTHMPSFDSILPMLLSEEDRINLLLPAPETPCNVVMYSSTTKNAASSQSSSKGGPLNHRDRFPPSNRGKFQQNRFHQHPFRPSNGQFGNQTAKPHHFRTEGLLGPGPALASPLKTVSQCQICKQHDHKWSVLSGSSLLH
ncbi:hypothetical protein LIER_09033 [Lithospermum erythrorhizon]|uniref:Uncharacterized protein n=1 Tax=Lithospermum erythrorhizon TaxID=34254 RepID=A0AAV3PFW6_LITER